MNRCEVCRTPGDLCQQRSNLFDELRRLVDRLACTIERHAGAGPQLVIGNRFQVVGLREKQGEAGKRLADRGSAGNRRAVVVLVSCGGRT
jgi:hypothetical protein